MKTLDEQMAIYAAYHRNRWNKLTHFVGVPAIVFAILVPMNWVPLGEGLSLAHLFTAAVLAYYFLLDVPLARHVFEGRRPALADNLFQIFVAPIFLVAELFFAFGLKREVLRKIEAHLEQTNTAK